MSTCWKCGKELPEGLVECESFCVAAGPADGEHVLNMVVVIRPKVESIGDPQSLEAFSRSLQAFMRMIPMAFEFSGLVRFCEKIEPPEVGE